LQSDFYFVNADGAVQNVNMANTTGTETCELHSTVSCLIPGQRLKSTKVYVLGQQLSNPGHLHARQHKKTQKLHN